MEMQTKHCIANKQHKARGLHKITEQIHRRSRCWTNLHWQLFNRTNFTSEPVRSAAFIQFCKHEAFSMECILCWEVSGCLCWNNSPDASLLCLQTSVKPPVLPSKNTSMSADTPHRAGRRGEESDIFYIWSWSKTLVNLSVLHWKV